MFNALIPAIVLLRQPKSAIMQATLDASALKRMSWAYMFAIKTSCWLIIAFTKAITCLSKYGDELSIYATSESLSLSATNSSKSAYCRFKYDSPFFSKYRVGTPQAMTDWENDGEKSLSVTGQLLTKVSYQSCYIGSFSYSAISPFSRS